MTKPWHEGERRLHAQAGVAGQMAEIGPRAIRKFMPDQHRQLFTQLPFILAGFVDQAGDVWASLTSGQPGFVSSPDPRQLDIAALAVPGDPLAAALTPELPLGLLGIELPTRRRNRINGHVLTSRADGFTFAVAESFGNCPKYIAKWGYGTLHEATVRQEILTGFDDAARSLITSATTFFIASSGGSEMLPDVSHRGAPPGFIKLDAHGTLTIPDYAGNFFFNTFGNILLYPRAGRLFADFESGDVLQLSGDAWLGDDNTGADLLGAERLWRFRMTKGHWLRGALPLRLTTGEASPFWPLTVQGQM